MTRLAYQYLYFLSKNERALITQSIFLHLELPRISFLMSYYFSNNHYCRDTLSVLVSPTHDIYDMDKVKTDFMAPIKSHTILFFDILSAVITIGNEEISQVTQSLSAWVNTVDGTSS